MPETQMKITRNVDWIGAPLLFGAGRRQSALRQLHGREIPHQAAAAPVTAA